MNKEHKTPCICNTCLKARDNEIRRVRENMIKELENEIPKWMKTSVVHTEVEKEAVECFLEYLKVLKEK